MDCPATGDASTAGIRLPDVASINRLKTNTLFGGHVWIKFSPLLHCRIGIQIRVVAAVIGLELEVALWTFSFCLGCLLSWRKPVVSGGLASAIETELWLSFRALRIFSCS